MTARSWDLESFRQHSRGDGRRSHHLVYEVQNPRMGQTAFYPQVIDGSAHGGFSLTHAMAPLPEQRLALVASRLGLVYRGVEKADLWCKCAVMRLVVQKSHPSPRVDNGVLVVRQQSVRWEGLQ